MKTVKSGWISKVFSSFQRYFVLCLALLSVLLLVAPPAHAQMPPVREVHFFYGDGCPHCEKATDFLESIMGDYPDFAWHRYEIYHNATNRALMTQYAQQLQAQRTGVPFLVVGNELFVGYNSPETTGKQILNALERMRAAVPDAPSTETEQSPDSIASESDDPSLLSATESATTTAMLSITPSTDSQVPPPTEPSLDALTLPIIGTLDLQVVSLPILTVLIAAVDGFNPCAMWTLLFLISLLLGMENRRRMWVLGTAFIVASAAVYFIFLAAWLNVFLVVRFIPWIKVLIGVAALVAGAYYLREAWTNRSGACKVTGNERLRRVFDQLKALTQRQSLWIALLGIISLAIAVNVVELVCSAGLPAIFTHILSLNELPSWQYYGYLLLYIVIFMIDDLFVFFTAMVTLKAVGVDGKYSRYSRIIGGVALLIIGLLMIFRPEWLLFG